MNKKILVAGLLAGVTLAGCQNLTDQLGSKIAESVINSSTNGQMKVNLDDLENGKVNVTTKEGTIAVNSSEGSGSVTMTDASGKTTTVNTDSGSGRPADAPADMPSVSEGQKFAYFTVMGATSLTFSVPSGDIKAVCDKQTDLITAAGWKVSTEGYSLETTDTITRNYDNATDNLMLVCGQNDPGISVALQKTKKGS